VWATPGVTASQQVGREAAETGMTWTKKFWKPIILKNAA
jgi:hypothetical protein